jgi:hypothetical protein
MDGLLPSYDKAERWITPFRNGSTMVAMPIVTILTALKRILGVTGDCNPSWYESVA